MQDALCKQMISKENGVEEKETNTFLPIVDTQAHAITQFKF